MVYHPFWLHLSWQSPAHVSCNKFSIFSIVSFVELLCKSDGWSWLPPWVILIELFGKDLLSTWHCNPDWAANSKEQRSQSIQLSGYIVAQDKNFTASQWVFLIFPAIFLVGLSPTHIHNRQRQLFAVYFSAFFVKGYKIIMYEQWMQFLFECDRKWEMFYQ